MSELNSKYTEQTSYKGMMSIRRSLSLPVGYCADSLNSDFGSSSQAAPMKGYSSYGHQPNKNQPTIRKYTYTKQDGTSILMQVRDNKTNYILEYLNTEDTRNNNQGEWSILESKLGRSVSLSDGSIKKANFGFSSFNDTGNNQLVYGNGIETPRIWNGAVASVKSINNDTGIVTALTINTSNPGINYNVGDILTIAGGVNGGAQVSSVSSGVVTAVSIVAAGINYLVNDVVTIPSFGGDGSGCTIKVTGINGGGGITTYTILTGGTGYFAMGSNLVTGGTGTGANFGITTVSSGVISGLLETSGGSGYSISTGNVTSGGSGTGAKIDISSVNTSKSIIINGTATVAQRGFVASNNILIINGVSYAYTTAVGFQFVGVTPDPTGIPVNSGIAQQIDSSTLKSIDKGSIFLTLGSRMFMAGIAATPNQVEYCKTGDITTWAAGTLPADPGFEDFPDLDGPATALSYIDNWVIVFSPNRILAFSFEYPTSTTFTTTKKVIADEGCPNQKAVRKIGDEIYYITPKGGIKKLSQVAATNVFNVEDLTDYIRPTLENFVWDDASLEYNTTRKVMIAAGKSNSLQSGNDKAINLWFSIDETGNQQINLGISDWFIGDMANYNGEIHFGLSLDCQDMLAFDGYSKNGAPYNWKRTERSEFLDNPWNKKRLPYIMLRGAIGNGTVLGIIVAYNINGSLSTQYMEITGLDGRFVIQSALNVLGGFDLGTNPLGGTIQDIGDLFPFDVAFPLPEINFKDVQITWFTNGAGQRVIIDTHAYAIEDAGQEMWAIELKELGITPNPIPTIN